MIHPFKSLLICCIGLLLTGSHAPAAPQSLGAEPVRLDIFYSPGCDECERVRQEIMPDFENLFEELYIDYWHDVSLATNVPLLIAYREHCRNQDNQRVAIVIDHTHFLSGFDQIAAGLEPAVKRALIARQDPAWRMPAAPLPEGADATELVTRKARMMTWSVVIGGGLLDGVNPCAISTLIFFMSLLVVSKAGRTTRLIVGGAFIGASFIVYTALGFGFLYLLRRMPSFPHIKLGFEITLGLAMLPLAYLSLRDAWRFRRSQRPADVTLQIPQAIKKRINRYMHSRLRWGGPLLGGLITGAGVTLLESVCTGQSYLPVLTYMLREGRFSTQSLLQLLTYNLCFITPLMIVFIAFHRGVEIKSFIAWSQRNLVVAKILLGLFFSAMALLFLWPALRLWVLPLLQ